MSSDLIRNDKFRTGHCQHQPEDFIASKSLTSTHEFKISSVSESNRSTNWYHLVAGAAAGTLTAVVTCPLEVLKTRLQNQSAQWIIQQKSHGSGISGPSRVYHGAPSVLLKKLYREEGARGFYRGLGPMIFGYLPTWTIYFWTYNTYKNIISKKTGLSIDNSVVHLLGALGGGFSSTLITNPIWIIKARMMTQHHTGHYNYKNTWDAWKSIFQTDGWRGFYRGLAVSLFGVTHVAIQFPIYEYLKLYGSKYTEKNQTYHTQANLLFASTMSKLIASACTYPHEILRTRLQTFKAEHNELYPKSSRISPVFLKSPLISDMVKDIWNREGLKGMYKGFLINLVRTVPASAVTLISYEFFMKFLTNHFDNQRELV